MEKLVDYKLQGVFLSFKGNETEYPIQLPQGIVQRKYTPTFYKDNNTIIAEINGELSQVYPAKTWEKDTPEGLSIKIRPAMTLKEQREAKKLLLNHYMGVPSRGMFINVYKEDKGHQFADLIACGCLDRLYYAMPLGRLDIATVAKDEKWVKILKNWKSKTKGLPDNAKAEIVDELRIAWISRLAVRDDWHGHNISPVLAETMGEIAHEAMLPHANFIEVFASYSEENVNDYTGEKNLFKKAGFDFYKEKGEVCQLKSSTMVFMDDKRLGYEERLGYIKAKKLYLYKDLR